MQTTLTVYKNRSNPVTALFYEDNVAMNFTSVTRVTCRLYNIDSVLVQTIDTNDSPVLITATDTAQSPNVLNAIIFTFNSLSLTGKFYSELIVYEPSRPDGRAIAHPSSPDDLLCFNFLNA